VVAVTYTAICERSGGWWAVHVPEVPGVFTQARRLDQAEAMVRDALALMLEVPEDSFDVELHPLVAPEAEEALAWLEKAKAEQRDAQAAVTEAAINAAKVLVGSGLTIRDAGRIMGVSFQRVDQLLHAA
jgi:predicted RNase H-like HicB family nuclease